MVKGQGLAVVKAAWVGVALLGTPFITTVAADTYFWDTNGSVAGQGSVTTPVNWLTNSWAAADGGLTATTAWNNNTATNSDLAYFKGTAGTVNVTTDVFANALRFDINGYTIAGTAYLHLVGANPNINTQLPADQNTATFSVPLTGSTGLNIDGPGGVKFVLFANTNTATQPNNYTGTLKINAGGSIRLGGGVANEQIPDSADVNCLGVVDFVTSGSAADGKQEKVRNVAVTGSSSNFSIGNGANFVVNSITATSTGTSAIALNGNSTASNTVPSRLTINGWSDGAGDLTLADGKAQMNATSGGGGIGSSIILSRDLVSSGTSTVINTNGGLTGDANDLNNVFTNKSLVFASATHNINVTSGTLTLTSRDPAQPLDVNSTFAGGTVLNKIGAGEVVFANAVQTSFVGTTKVSNGTLTLGAAERLANNSNLEVAGGTFNTATFAETVTLSTLASGSITGSGVLTATGGYAVQSGSSSAPFAGSGLLTKTTAGLVTLTGANTYSGNTLIQAGTLKLGASAHANAINSVGFTDIQSGALVFDSPTAPNKTSILAKLDTAAAGAFLTGQFRSSTANASKGLGYTDDGTLFTIAPTRYGDTNLDQFVNVTDLLAISQFYLQTTNTTWGRGDFNYSHTITIADLQLLVTNYTGNMSADKQTVFATNPSQQFINDLNALTVPEPTTLAWVFGAAMFARRRMRR